VELEKNLLTLTEIESGLEYESEEEANTGSVLFLYTSPFIIPPLSSLPTLIVSFPIYYNISQYGSINMEQILLQMRQQ